MVCVGRMAQVSASSQKDICDGNLPSKRRSFRMVLPRAAYASPKLRRFSVQHSHSGQIGIWGADQW